MRTRKKHVEIDDICQTRASKIAGSVRFNTDGMYFYFQPNELPFDLSIDRDIYRKSLDAVISLGNLNGRVSGRKRNRLYLADGVLDILMRRRLPSSPIL